MRSNAASRNRWARCSARERVGLGVDHLVQVVDGLGDGLLEQREQQLVLAVEVLVEAAQRLLRPFDDLLDRELGRALLVDQLERGVDEPLRPLLGAGAGRAQAARQCAFPPRGLTPLPRVLRPVGSCHRRRIALSRCRPRIPRFVDTSFPYWHQLVERVVLA